MIDGIIVLTCFWVYIHITMKTETHYTSKTDIEENIKAAKVRGNPWIEA